MFRHPHRLFHWGQRFLIWLLVWLLGVPLGPVQALSQSYHWSTTPHREIFTQLWAFVSPAEAQAAESCDLDHDGDIDRDDITLLFAARGTEVTIGDPLDINQDGVVTVNDARVCVLECTKPECALNAPPVAVDDAYDVDEDAVLTIAAPGVLGNDTDTDNDALSAVLVTDPANGTLTLNADGSFTYTPEPDFNGPDSFTYKTNDSIVDSNTATVTLTVRAVNDPPTIISTPVTEATEGQLYTYDVEATDPDVGDVLTFSLDTAPAGMTIDPATGLIEWTPDAAQVGDNGVTVRAQDLGGLFDTQSFTVAVASGNHPPMAEDDAYEVEQDTILTVTAPGVLGNDSDLDGDTLTAELLTDPANGTVTLNPDGSFTYTPNTGFNGPDSFTYHANDGQVNSAPATVALTVTEPRDLTLTDVDASGLVFDGQAMTVAGNVTATVTNQGPGIIPGPFDVLFFEDLDHNGRYDAALDNALGSTTVTDPLPAGQSLPVTASLSGIVQFSGIFIWGFVDSGNVISETDEENNLSRSGLDCQFIPEPGQFNPVVEWVKDAFEVRPELDQVIMTPAVIDLNTDGIPDIVFSTFQRAPVSSVTFAAILRAISGADGSELWSATDPAHVVYAPGSIATGDIDLDGHPEIIAVGITTDVLIAFEHDGTFKWQSPAIWSPGTGSFIGYGGASIADLDQDGTPEIIVGASVLNNDGTIRWEGNTVGGQGRGDNDRAGLLSLVADLDLDGSPEVVAGKSAYRADGSLFWNAAIPDGLSAVGNFDEDAFPEIVVVANGSIYLLEHTGTVKWGPVTFSGGGRGGPPTVADVDNDGEPEIGVAGAGRYTVLETDGSVKWQRTTQDMSSGVTGSSVFDFDGDGNAEVIYGDELFLRIYRGTDGTVLYELPKGSGTAYELPLIADVDADGNAEIVATANNYAFGNQQGIYIIGDANDTWVPTRQIWNQHTYHITNVNDDGTIPTVEANSWDVHNTYRLNRQTLPGGPLAAPDLIPSYVSTAVQNNVSTVTARIGNGGGVLVGPDIQVAFYDGDPRAGGVLRGVTNTTVRLEPGTFEDVSMTLSVQGVNDLWVVADDDGTGKGQVNECDEENNFYHPNVNLPPPTGANPPSITSTPPTAVIAGHLYTYNVEATDPDVGESLVFSLLAAPIGMTIDAVSGLIEWFPANTQAGDHPATVRVLDSTGLFDTQSFTITVGLDIPTVAVPDVVGLPQADAETAILAVNLTVGTITIANSDTVPEGNVISQDPAAGTEVAEGSSVDLVVSLGPPAVTVPDVLGQPQAEAEAAIMAANLMVGNITTANSDSVPAGNVISQDPVAGTEVAPQTAVDLVVSLGSPVNLPPVALDDTYEFDQDTTRTVAAPGVLANDSDPDGDPLTAILTGQTCVAPAAGLAAWWPGDGPGNLVGTVDSDLALRDGASFREGLVGQALSLDAHAGQWATAAVAPSANTFTLEGWLWLDSSPGSRPIYYGSDPRGLWLDSRRLYWKQGAGGFLGNIAIPEGEWHHFAITYENTTFAGYIDGQLDGTSSFIGASLPDTNVVIGFAFDGGGLRRFFNGLIDELSIYTRALSIDEIQAIVAAGRVGKCKTADLIAALENGIVTLKDDGSFTFKPDPGFTGTEHVYLCHE